MKISVVIPCYNAADWLPKTIPRVVTALEVAKIAKAEIIIVDDGSRDDSFEVAKNLKSKYPIKVIHQENSGRFLARKAGVDSAIYEYLLLVDTRVFLDEKSIKFLETQLMKYPKKIVWNGHVNVYKKGNIIARFMDTVTNIGWRRYFSNPRTCSYGLEDFDYYPKGTGCFFIKKQTLLDAMEKFLSQTNDVKNSSDDTLLIRIIAERNRINISPSFSCTYFARNTLSQFLKHTYFRGQFFIDGFLRYGTRFFYPLIIFFTISALIPFLLSIYPFLFLPIIYISIAVWLTGLLGLIVLGISIKDALSFFILSPVFTIMYSLGLWRGLIRKYGRV